MYSIFIVGLNDRMLHSTDVWRPKRGIVRNPSLLRKVPHEMGMNIFEDLKEPRFDLHSPAAKGVVQKSHFLLAGGCHSHPVTGLRVDQWGQLVQNGVHQRDPLNESNPVLVHKGSS
ncbi:hypothetical protein GN956_G26924 [Arapaima gigas]